MARVKIENIIEHLDHDLRRALENTVRSQLRDAHFDPHSLFREFVREVGRRCSTWERVPDSCVEKD